MNEPFLISIIVPMYNVEKYIGKCASSLFGQTYRSIEFIFINDCSTDGTVDELEKCLADYPERKGHVRIISNASNKGVAYSRNVGLKLATGAYIGWCDGDDWVDDCMFEDLARKIQETGSDIAYCDYVCEGTDKKVVHVTSLTNEDKESMLSDYMAKDSLCPLWNKLVDRCLFTENDVHFKDGLDYCEDFNVSVKLLFYAKKIAFQDKVYYHYRENPSSICHSANKEKSLSGFKNVIDVYEFLRSTNPSPMLERCMAYNVLNAKLWLWYNYQDITSLQVCPETNRYIFSNPFLGIKGKLFAFAVYSLYAMMRWVINHVKI